MTKDQQMLDHVDQIKAFASVLGLHNWRDIRLHINRHFDELDGSSIGRGSVIPCHRGGHKCSWPACSPDCDGRPGHRSPATTADK
jgi:hypothetical protein